jgi:hypothetical protein
MLEFALYPCFKGSGRSHKETWAGLLAPYLTRYPPVEIGLRYHQADQVPNKEGASERYGKETTV